LAATIGALSAPIVGMYHQDREIHNCSRPSSILMPLANVGWLLVATVGAPAAQIVDISRRDCGIHD
jgi:hypothetical protein